MVSVIENQSGSSGLSLAVRLREGSTEAWRELVELYGPLVDSWAARAGLSATAREDIVQEVFLSVHRGIEGFNPGQPGATFRGWLWRITRNAVLQSFRKQEPNPRGGSTAQAELADYAEPTPDAWPEISLLEPPSSSQDTTSLLKRALRQIETKIEPQTWRAFWLTVVQGQATAEVAEQLGLSPAAVRKAKSRTLQRLRKQLGDLG